jgi:hypothetical protein
VLRVGRTARIQVTARASAPANDAAATGVLAVRSSGSQTLRIPWAVAFPVEERSLLPRASLDRTQFRSSDGNLAVLTVRAGVVVEAGGTQILPAERLDVLLYKAGGRFVGVLTRLRDVLPGTYQFGITGRGPSGVALKPGRYELRLVAWPMLHGKPSRARVPFEIL